MTIVIRFVEQSAITIVDTRCLRNLLVSQALHTRQLVLVVLIGVGAAGRGAHDHQEQESDHYATGDGPGLRVALLPAHAAMLHHHGNAHGTRPFPWFCLWQFLP